jgi:hypothetical protein
MFKKVFQTIRRAFAGGEQPGPGNKANTRRQPSDKTRSLLDKISTPPPAGRSSAPASSARAGRPGSPEELCGISPKMSKDEIKARLALLYRRYNRATSSLDTKLRAEAETMLDAIVAVREKTFGPI